MSLYVPDEKSWPSQGSSDRNKQEISDVLAPYLSKASNVFEVASGFGKHIALFAHDYPNAKFQPTEAQEQLIEEIKGSITKVSGESWYKNNINEPFLLNLDDDAGVEKVLEGYEKDGSNSKFDGLISINLVHISPARITQKLFRFASRLKVEWIAFYGPFKKSPTEFYSEADAKFEESLKSRNSEWGLRLVDEELVPNAVDNGFSNTYDKFNMNKGNFIIVFKRVIK